MLARPNGHRQAPINAFQEMNDLEYTPVRRYFAAGGAIQQRLIP